MKTLLAFSVFFLASMFNALGGVDILKAARDGDPKAQIAMAAELIKTNQPDKIAEGIVTKIDRLIRIIVYLDIFIMISARRNLRNQ